jgi:hypothetical protein
VDRARRGLLQVSSGSDDAQATRAALTAFDERMRVMRNALSEGRGSFEWYYVPRKKQPTPEASEYLLHGEPVPQNVQKYVKDDRPPYGPYLRFITWEGGVRIQMNLGRIKRYNPAWSNHPPAL